MINKELELKFRHVRHYLSKIMFIRSRYFKRGMKVTITGHNDGGALAILAALELKKTNYFLEFHPFEVYTFGSPKVGNIFFAFHYFEYIKNSFRVVYDAD